ncbi:MAG TPA: uridine kinase [Polyangiaceae bacterium]
MSAEPPFFVAVVGGTGSGKSTVAERIVEAMPAGSVSVIAHDNYYRPRPDLTLADREQLNFDHPDALDNPLLIEHLDALRAGSAVQTPVYDFATHLRLDTTRAVQPTRVVIVEGILLLVDRELRARLDLKLYVDTDADVRILRRLQRDMEQRGRTFDQVLRQYTHTVRPMHLQFVEPSKRYADVIIPEGGHNDVAMALVVSRLQQLLVS